MRFSLLELARNVLMYAEKTSFEIRLSFLCKFRFLQNTQVFRTKAYGTKR